MDRRRFLAGTAAVVSTLGMPSNIASAPAQTRATPFDDHLVRETARNLAQTAYKKPDNSLPKELQDVSYDAYRAIRFRPQQALWRDEGLPFQVQFFHRGFIFSDRVDIFVVTPEGARPVNYSPDLFDFGDTKPPPQGTNVGFAGFRMHARINQPDYYDEVGVFLGASYFRAVAKGQVYGLSGRGLSLKTGDPAGEEFPAFKAFWIEKPTQGTNSLVVHALLDSPSAAAAYRFTIRPGDTTIYDVEMTLFPRVDLDQVGVGSNVSMFFFDANDRVGVDDFRDAVHDSDGLAIRNGRGEEIWRPLSNPRDLQVSTFNDVNPRGFGLMQRERDFQAYLDLESSFEKRPSLWVEPIGDWGEGAVQLIEIPTKEEIHDNIVAYWRPRRPLQAKREYSFTYRLHWGWDKPDGRALARFGKTRVGGGPDGSRLFVLELNGDELTKSAPETLRATVTADKGEIRNVVLQGNPQSGGYRISFELHPNDEPVVELRGLVTRADQPASEVWLYRWSA